MAWVERNPAAVDWAIALALSAAAVISLSTTIELLRQDPAFEDPARAGIIVSLLAVTLPLAWRRRYPLSIAVVVIGAFVISRIAFSTGAPLLPWENTVTVWACWIALYTAVAYGRNLRATTVVVAALILVLYAEVVREIFFVAGGAFSDLPLNEAFLVVSNLVFVVLPVLLGIAVRSLRERSRELAEQTVELRREREENARRAVLEERVRIARELHDVVAHHVSVMGVQAGAARRVMAKRPDQAEAALSSIEASSRQAVVELHRLLGVLRREGQDDALAPQPDLAQLPELIAQATRGELTVDLAVEGEPRPLPGTLELSVYRVIQEALTNALKHSGGTAATVRVTYEDSTLEVDVADDGHGVGPAGGSGHGLIGMRERVRLHGGHLRAGPDPAGGFVVHASFPLNGGGA
jgi:signal transduction histidine kinase